MSGSTDRVRAAIESGCTDAVNGLVDAPETLDEAESREAFEAILDWYVPRYGEGDLDGYRRRAIGRVLDAFGPTIAFPPGGFAVGESGIEGTSDTRRYRRALFEFRLETLRDEDGRVRQWSTIHLLGPLAVAVRSD